jgi:phosphotransferase system HPr (HPr) family protein
VSDALVHESEYEVRSELGLHARPAGKFVALASRFESRISVGRGNEWVDGRSILSLLSLAAARGSGGGRGPGAVAGDTAGAGEFERGQVTPCRVE